MQGALAACVLGALLLPGASAAWNPVTGEFVNIDTPNHLDSVAASTWILGHAGNNRTLGAPLPPGWHEAVPLRGDAAGDGGDADLGNVWLTNDTGTRFQLHVRIHELADWTSTHPAAESPYMVEFTLASTGIR